MGKRNWKRARARSLRHGMELCLEYARDRHNRSVDQVADLMGLPSKWTLYKWMENGRIPGILIRPFEHACGANFVTQYLATSDHKLLVDIPTGKRATQLEVNALQASFARAMGLVIQFYEGDAEAQPTLEALTEVMSGLAWHRENVNKNAEPELHLFEGDD